jgi:NAD(P)-dependent dehydrogenase (short-subunit alcohol dehydrogenase family)
MNTARSLAGRVVAVTGGARGIGFAVAQCCAKAGMRVAIGDLDPELARASAAGLGTDHLGSGLDITSRDEFATFIDRTEKQLGALDVLINNAGVFTSGSYADEPHEITERVVLTNLLGTMVGTKIAVQRMLPRGDGHIVNISSIGAVLPAGGAVTYSAAKAGVLGLSRALRDELAGTGIRVTVVLPGTIATEMTAPLAPPPPGTPKPLPASAAADAIVRALRTGRRELYVPGLLGPVATGLALLPPGASDTVKRLAGFHKAVADSDPARVRAYQERVAAERAAHARPRP